MEVKLWFGGYKKGDFVKIASKNTYYIVTKVDGHTITIQYFGDLKPKWFYYLKLTLFKIKFIFS